MKERGLPMIIDEIEKMIKEDDGIKIKNFGSFNTSESILTPVSVIVRSYNGCSYEKSSFVRLAIPVFLN